MEQAADDFETLSEAFVAMISPRQREGRRVVEDAEFIAMLWRMIRALEARAIERPENLTQVVALAQRLAEVVNVAVAVNAQRFKIDPRRGASMLECGRALGIGKASISERRATGERIIAARHAAAGVTRFGEAKREREAIDAAATHAATSLTEYRARHLRVA